LVVLEKKIHYIAVRCLMDAAKPSSWLKDRAAFDEGSCMMRAMSGAQRKPPGAGRRARGQELKRRADSCHRNEYENECECECRFSFFSIQL
jgi:hypothetical protein